MFLSWCATTQTSTTFHMSTLLQTKMSPKTRARRLDQLVSQLASHPEREEILKLVKESLVDGLLVRQDTNDT